METTNSPNGGPRFQTESGHQTKIIISRPDEIVRHEISDEELQMLSDMKRDWTMEALWGVLGGAIGAAKGATSALIEAYGEDKPKPMPTGDLIEIVLFFICVSAAVVLAGVYFLRSSGAKNLARDIRNRRTQNNQREADIE